jgi:zinc transport system ATP-binding protein
MRVRLPTSAAILLDDVSVRQGGLAILSPISAGIERHSVTAIIGPNGAGKTTLLKAILGLIPYFGRVEFLQPDGSPRRKRPRIGYVPQRLDFDRSLPMTVSDLLAVGIQRRPIWMGVSSATRAEIRRHLEAVEADQLIDRPLGKLSGGELQRVQLALALQMDPEIILLDEPVAGVDVAGESLFCDMLQRVQQECRLTMVMVSHDLSVVSQHATHALCINRGLVAAGPVREVLTPDVLTCLFGPHSMVAEIPGLSAHRHHDHVGPCDHRHE